jgi:hypothetical protein
MSEFALQEKIVTALRSNVGTWRNIPIIKSTSDARTMFDLLGDREHGRDFDLQRWIGTLDGFTNVDVRAQVTGYILRQAY